MELAQQIRALRLKQGLSQDELAAAIYVTRQTVSNWENDKTYPDLESLVLLSEYFDISTDELLCGDVVTMKKIAQDDAKRVRQLCTASFVMVALAVIFFIALTAAWTDPFPHGGLTKGIVAGLCVFAPLYGLGLYFALKIEGIKRKHDPVTYREIVAFIEGTQITDAREDHLFAREHPIASTALKIVFAVCAGAMIGLLIYKLTSSAFL